MRDTRYENGFTLVELLVALMITSVILTAVVTLAYAMGTANDISDDTAQKQAQLRYATVRVSELIRHCKLICATTGDDLAIWRADDNDDGKINPTELVYLEAGQERDYLQLLDFSWSVNWNLSLDDIRDINTKDVLIMTCTERRTLIMPECSNVEFTFDAAPPNSGFVSISFGLSENNVVCRYQINAALCSRAGHLLDGAGNIVEDDD